MKRFLEILRSLMLWGLSWLHFLIVVPALIALAIILDPRKHDYLQRGLCRRIAFFSGAKVLVKEEPGFDRTRTSFFMVNHVNLFDPFILYCVIPQLVRGWELESHFRIPIYGWLMKRFGNVPVPNSKTGVFVLPSNSAFPLSPSASSVPSITFAPAIGSSVPQPSR